MWWTFVHSAVTFGIFEYASGGDIEQMIDFDTAKVDWNSTERLVVAYQVAASIADAHDSERNGVTTLAHTDITTGQFVHVESTQTYKLNDINRCRFIARDENTGEPCKFEVGNNPGTFRAPEEYWYFGEDEKIDIYSMGSVCYVALTAVWPFDDIETKKAQKLVKKGERPPITQEFLNSTDPAFKALIKAINMCWQHRSDLRPSASEMRDFFKKELKQLNYWDD